LGAEQVPTLEEAFSGLNGYLWAGVGVELLLLAVGSRPGETALTTPQPILPVIPPNNRDIIIVANELFQ
jgi:hypothetical protein